MLPQRDSAVHRMGENVHYLTEPGVQMYLKALDQPPKYGMKFYGISIKAFLELLSIEGAELPKMTPHINNTTQIRFIECPEYRQDPALHGLFLHSAHLAKVTLQDEIERLEAFEVFHGPKKGESIMNSAAKKIPLFAELKVTAKGREPNWLSFLDVCRTHQDNELKTLGFKTLECLKEVSMVFNEYHNKHYNLVAKND